MAAYLQNIDRCLRRHIGDGGLSDADFAAACTDAAGAYGTLLAALDNDALALATALADEAGLAQAIEAAAPALGGASRIIVIGTGGSSLGAKALTAVRRDAAAGPAMVFCENADSDSLPDTTGGFRDTAILAISKSGATAEVLGHLALLWAAATRELGDAAAARFLAIAGPGENPLRSMAAARKIPVIEHDPDLGGRYSAFSPVCLLPAHYAGLDIGAVQAGAAAVLEDLRGNGAGSAPALGAAAMVGLMRMDRQVSVFMPYADRLRDFSRWFCQLWAESLGKSGQGAVPYPAVGAVDQHSQLQLWLDGPDNAAFTLLSPQHAGGAAIDTGAADDLDGRTLADLITAQYRATADILAAHGRPVRTFDIAAPVIGEREVGALMMHFMLETVIAGHMLGVDPFSQPAVDDGKRRTRKYLSGG